MRTYVLTAAQRHLASEIWIALEAEIGSANLACSWEWTATWLEHYGDAVAHRFVVGEDEHGVRGIALVCEQAGLGRLRPPTILIGTAGEPPGSSVFVERNRLLARPADRAAFAAALLGELEHDRRWQRLRLDGMLPADADALLDGYRSVRRRTEESPIARLGTSAPGADLPALGGPSPGVEPVTGTAGYPKASDVETADTETAAAAREPQEILALLPSGARRRVRQSFRRLQPLHTEWAQSESAARSILEELISLHQARWNAAGEPGAFASTRFIAFHRDLVGQLLPSRRVALFRVRHGHDTLACLYGLVEGERLLFYQSGMAHSQDNRLRPGLLAHALFMQACRERGLRVYDFLAPAARYKRELASESEQLVWAQLERDGMRIRLERTGRAAKNRLRGAGSRESAG